ncbi:hypothetical protein HanRHA438_Chr08g0351131 [Helianthus annuus]|nr:hypothetical protein HanRHA438_Chr08g0351131 [Helianthus annuus]
MRASGDPYLSVGRSNYLGGDKPLAALKLLQKVDDLNYLVLECSAERTLADRYQRCCRAVKVLTPGVFSEWMQLLLPLAVRKECALLLTWVQKYNPDVVITSRVADASLFLAPMV